MLLCLLASEPTLIIPSMLSRIFTLLAVLALFCSSASAQDTVTVQTLTFDSVGRMGYFHFPPKSEMGTFEKVVMQYRMRCIGGKVRTTKTGTVGCGEWDYNCETYIIDSSRVDSLQGESTWTYAPQKFEIMSFVTPYGIQLDLGKEGKMWEFDVTDYLPILNGDKILSVERGAWQEELDIRFLFIKGTPARNVLNIQQLWPATEENYQNIQSDKRFPALDVSVPAEAKTFKIRSMITGHGQEGEFITRNHTITVNGEEFTREVVKQCSENPVYPQGGTWVYTRAGWCPGAPTDLAEYDVTANMSAENIIDYTVQSGSGDSRYVVNNQLVSYGAPNFTNNATLVEVRRPSDRVEFARYNPAATQPIITVRNNGAAELTSLTIHYGVEGAPMNTYEWKGDVIFNDTVQIVLPTPSTWGEQATNIFKVHIANPNGQADEYMKDDSYASRFVKAPVYSGGIVIRYRTNNVPEQNWYQITDKDGKIVIENPDISEPTTTYYDSLTLAPGNYTFSFYDEGENGINWWASPDDGAGTLAFRKNSATTGTSLKTFNPDFGHVIHYDFTISGTASVDPVEAPLQLVRVFPNPATSTLRIDLKGYDTQNMKFAITNITGKRFLEGALDSNKLDISQLPVGHYTLELISSEGTAYIQFLKE